MTDAEELIVQVDRLRRACAGWSAARWAAPALSTGDGRSKAAVAYDLAQRLADLAADAELSARRVVPRLGERTVLDQVRTLAHDVLRAGDADVTGRALAVVREHRAAIDGSRPG